MGPAVSPGQTFRHGTLFGYVRHRCRCDSCREAASARARLNRLKRADRIPLEAHGTTNGYGNYKCRCDRCRDAYITWARHEYATGYRRRDSVMRDQIVPPGMKACLRCGILTKTRVCGICKAESRGTLPKTDLPPPKKLGQRSRAA